MNTSYRMLTGNTLIAKFTNREEAIAEYNKLVDVYTEQGKTLYLLLSDTTLVLYSNYSDIIWRKRA